MRSIPFLFLVFWGSSVLAATIRVPQDHPTIQAAVDAAQPGDTVLVSPGRYRERIRMRPGIILRSEGDDTRGEIGLKRAEKTVVDGGGEKGDQPGVVLGEDSTLDGFTVTSVGLFNEPLWQKHFDSQGEEMQDDDGAAQAEGSVPAISVRGVNGTVINNIAHHNGDVGIAVLGSEDRRITPEIAHNVSFRNMGGGIGIADTAEPLVRGNICYENLRAGIGCRNSSPIILGNECYRNVRAGIGCREGAKPLLRENKCYRNRRAGIGIRMEGTAPLVEKNECFENDMAGIGLNDRAAAVIRGNSCVDNQRVAIGIVEGSVATLCDNELSRTGGAPPIIAVRGRAKANIHNNRITGGGVAAILIQGTVLASGNRIAGQDEGKGNGIWIQEDSNATITDNSITGYHTAVTATKASVVIVGNTLQGCRGPAIVVKESRSPAQVVGNRALSADSSAAVVLIEGSAGTVADNVVTPQ